MSELLQATCPEGHTWDVWADDDRRIKRADLRCPSCWAEGEMKFAERVDEPESLA
jgi:hypothetical protein